MDDADAADQRITDAVTEGIARVRDRMTYRELEPCGNCHYCTSPVAGSKLFCCGDCSDDYERAKGNR